MWTFPCAEHTSSFFFFSQSLSEGLETTMEGYFNSPPPCRNVHGPVWCDLSNVGGVLQGFHERFRASFLIEMLK